jgi:predicted transcriptional regulator
MAVDQQLITLTADIVASHVANNNVSVNDVGNLIQRVHEALSALGRQPEEEPQGKTPVVSIRASIRPDYLVCMECGAKQKMLKRHLSNAHGMTPSQYRQDYGLPRDYPMVAPNYSEQRRTLARSIGLGRKSKRAAEAEAPQVKAETKLADRGKGTGRKRAPKAPAA